ncbi:hypothetical protein [Thioclava sp. SK-1]|uniref:hypothetical protein n=1 Tax=Thioclava sp. SK-1 TaxID=1889770 RepID=UPI0021010DF1|nr:hypothetical protein [Thioclava sp. SK-1]
MPDQPYLPALSDDDLRETLDLMATAVASMSVRRDNQAEVSPRLSRYTCPTGSTI